MLKKRLWNWSARSMSHARCRRWSAELDVGRQALELAGLARHPRHEQSCAFPWPRPASRARTIAWVGPGAGVAFGRRCSGAALAEERGRGARAEDDPARA